MIGLLLFGGLIVLLALGVPIAISLGALTVVGLYVSHINMALLAQNALRGSQSITLLAIPGFVLAGEVMSKGGLSKRLINIASALVGHVHGGLSMATVLSGTLFGAITGSAPATTAAIGGIMIDELSENGYTREYSAALATSIGPLGQMIPPSIPMIVWGTLAQESIAKLFLAGVIPGILSALGYMIVSYFYARRRGIQRVGRLHLAAIARSLRDGAWALLAPILILGGIYGGVFTPTESSMVGVVYGLIVGLFVYRELKWRDIPRIFLNAMRTTGMIMFILVMAQSFAWLLAFGQVPTHIATALTAATHSKVLILIVINLLLLFLGAFMETIAAMLILGTVLIHIGNLVGMAPIQLGAMVVINFAVGMITPPIGSSLYVGAAISRLKMETVAAHLLPFFLVLVIVVALVAFVPSVTLFLPGLLH